MSFGCRCGSLFVCLCCFVCFSEFLDRANSREEEPRAAPFGRRRNLLPWHSASCTQSSIISYEPVIPTFRDPSSKVFNEYNNRMRNMVRVVGAPVPQYHSTVGMRMSSVDTRPSSPPRLESIIFVSFRKSGNLIRRSFGKTTTVVDNCVLRGRSTKPSCS